MESAPICLFREVERKQSTQIALSELPGARVQPPRHPESRSCAVVPLLIPDR
jgi:hypothetical protein